MGAGSFQYGAGAVGVAGLAGLDVADDASPFRLFRVSWWRWDCVGGAGVAWSLVLRSLEPAVEIPRPIALAVGRIRHDPCGSFGQFGIEADSGAGGLPQFALSFGDILPSKVRVERDGGWRRGGDCRARRISFCASTLTDFTSLT